jgi:hypothetical protein
LAKIPLGDAWDVRHDNINFDPNPRSLPAAIAVTWLLKRRSRGAYQAGFAPQYPAVALLSLTKLVKVRKWIYQVF